MLVLTRLEGEKVIARCMCCGEEMTVTVVRLNGKRVKLGFEASPDVRVDREEVYQERARRQTAAEAHIG